MTTDNKIPITEHKREEFFNSFLATLLWSESDGNDHNLDANYDVDDYAPQVKAGLLEQCQRFIDENADTLLRVEKDRDYTFSRAGYDFCLSRNGHGAGFFDRDLEEDGDALQDACEAFGQAEAYPGDDGKIYVVGLETFGQEKTVKRTPKA